MSSAGVLVADDDPQVLMMLETMLKETPWVVQTARDGRELNRIVVSSDPRPLGRRSIAGLEGSREACLKPCRALLVLS